MSHMDKDINEIEALKARIKRLEQENAQLKALLYKAGTDGTAAAGCVSEPAQDFDRDQGARIIPERITRNHARLFYSYFWGRTDVYSKRSRNKTTGKAGYYPQCDNFWRHSVCPKASGLKVQCKDCNNRRWTKLEGIQIENHLRAAIQVSLEEFLNTFEGYIMENGVPFNMTLPKSDFKAERAAKALLELSNAAAENGTSEMTLEEINAEIDSSAER